MRKYKLYIATSLDGYVAEKNGKIDFLNGDESDTDNQGTYNQFIETIDTVILGFNTYNQIVTELSPDFWPYQGMKTYVLTSKILENKEEVEFIDLNIEELVEKINSTNGKDVWICGGAKIATEFHKLNLIDEYTISLIPSILGDGIKLFENITNETRLKLINSVIYNGIVENTYIPIKKA